MTRRQPKSTRPSQLRRWVCGCGALILVAAQLIGFAHSHLTLNGSRIQCSLDCAVCEFALHAPVTSVAPALITQPYVVFRSVAPRENFPRVAMAAPWIEGRAPPAFP